ncbi:CKLF-like MARVEL transmembrane domain-containing protein 5-like protein [Amazona aestiva]|uniref:CKLF-like MARVEL transmembrane domain-containing protein 5-like protein n=1 Tax=Amazona aestiva TaxID=12930 RepID=A0A0Q3X9C7_AMAAE|nr:CKLF-like MARVEL transmembrane domain-containing protein 5-like protein [Amazona aestiva]
MSPQVLCGAVVGLLAPPAPPTLAPALLQALAVAAALVGQLLRNPPRLPHGYGPCLDLLRAVSGTIIFLVVALVALAASRDALAATTFTFSLILSFLFAFDAFVTYHAKVAPVVGQDGTNLCIFKNDSKSSMFNKCYEMDCKLRYKQHSSPVAWTAKRARKVIREATTIDIKDARKIQK